MGLLVGNPSRREEEIGYVGLLIESIQVQAEEPKDARPGALRGRTQMRLRGEPGMGQLWRYPLGRRWPSRGEAVEAKQLLLGSSVLSADRPMQSEERLHLLAQGTVEGGHGATSPISCATSRRSSTAPLV